MAIVKMKKFTLYTTRSKEDDTLFQLHKYGKVQMDKVEVEEEMDSGGEIFSFSESSSYMEKIRENITKVNYMIDTLTPYEKKLSMIEKYKRGKPSLDYIELSKVRDKIEIDKLYDEIKFSEEKIKSISQEISLLKSENNELNRYIKFNMNEDELNKYIKLKVDEKNLKKLRYHQCIIGSLPDRNHSKLIKELDKRETIYFLEDLGTIQGNKLIFIIFNKYSGEIIEETLRENGFVRINFELINDNLSRIEQISNEQIEHNEKLKGLADNLPLLREAYDFFENENLKEEAKNNILKTRRFSIIQGWIADDNHEEFQRLLNDSLGYNYYIDIEDADKDDKSVPILLKNNLLNSSFQSITQLYSYPKYNEIDPTPVLTPFYLLFFSMMVADVGYGLLMLVASSIALKLFNLSKSQKDFMRFFFFLSFPTIIVGFIYGGFFGDAIQLPALIDSSNIMMLLVISIALGVIHVFCGLFVKAYMLIRDGKLIDAIYDVFTWYFALIGAIGLLLVNATDLLPKSLSLFFIIIMVIGAVGIVLTNGRDNKTVFGKLAGGLYALYGISSYIGDFISYSRIMALGLAGGYIAFAFNMVINMLPVWARFTFGIGIFIFAHLFNLFLGALGAYVHTCRLQYVEYFGKFYEGGGRPFKPFKSSEKYIEIKDK